jgi:hypothetical protein
MVSRWILDGDAIGHNSKMKSLGKQGTEEVYELPAGTYSFTVKNGTSMNASTAR